MYKPLPEHQDYSGPPMISSDGTLKIKQRGMFGECLENQIAWCQMFKIPCCVCVLLVTVHFLGSLSMNAINPCALAVCIP